MCCEETFNFCVLRAERLVLLAGAILNHCVADSWRGKETLRSQTILGPSEPQHKCSRASALVPLRAFTALIVSYLVLCVHHHRTPFGRIAVRNVSSGVRSTESLFLIPLHNVFADARSDAEKSNGRYVASGSSRRGWKGMRENLCRSTQGGTIEEAHPWRLTHGVTNCLPLESFPDSSER